MKTIKKLMIVSVLCARIVAVEQTPERFKECEDVRSALIVSMKKYSKPSEDVLKKFPKCGQENSHHRRNGEDGTPLLYTAARYGSVEVVDAVLDSGVDIEEKNPNCFNETALHPASRHGHVNAVDRLLAHGANPNSKDNNMWTPAHNAACLGRLDVLKKLHKSGADLNAQDHYGNTLLHNSLNSAFPAAVEVTQYLIDQKADLNVKCSFRITPLRKAIDYVIRNGHDSKYPDQMNIRRESIQRLALAGADYSDFTDNEKAELFKIIPELELKQAQLVREQEEQEKLVREIEELIERNEAY